MNHAYVLLAVPADLLEFLVTLFLVLAELRPLEEFHLHTNTSGDIVVNECVRRPNSCVMDKQCRGVRGARHGAGLPIPMIVTSVCTMCRNSRELLRYYLLKVCIVALLVPLKVFNLLLLVIVL